MPTTVRILIAGALFATGGALIKSCEFPSLQRAAVRALAAAITIFAWMPEARCRPDRRVLVLVPAYFVATCCFVVANSLTTAANTIFLQSTAPLWVLLLSPMIALAIHNEQPHALTFVGGALIVGSVAVGSLVRRPR